MGTAEVSLSIPPTVHLNIHDREMDSERVLESLKNVKSNFKIMARSRGLNTHHSISGEEELVRSPETRRDKLHLNLPFLMTILCFARIEITRLISFHRDTSTVSDTSGDHTSTMANYSVLFFQAVEKFFR